MRAWLELRFELVTSAEQIEELRRVLAYRKLRRWIRPEQAREFVDNIEVMAEMATDLPVVDASPDPTDNVILATAIAGRAHAIVSGDKSDVVALREVGGIPIVSARVAAEWLALDEP